MPENDVRKKKRTRNWAAGNWFCLLALLLLLPILMGGCPEFQDDVVTAFETATRGLVNAALELLFDQYRSDLTL